MWITLPPEVGCCRCYLTPREEIGNITPSDDASPPSMLDAGPPILPVSPYLTNYIRPSFNHALRIWWAFFWQTTVISAILAAAIEFGMLGVVYEHRNVRGNLIGPIMRFMPYVISYVVAFFIMEYILHKNFRHFRIGLVSCGGEFTSHTMPATSHALCESGGLIRGEP